MFAKIFYSHFIAWYQLAKCSQFLKTRRYLPLRILCRRKLRCVRVSDISNGWYNTSDSEVISHRGKTDRGESFRMECQPTHSDMQHAQMTVWWFSGLSGLLLPSSGATVTWQDERKDTAAVVCSWWHPSVRHSLFFFNTLKKYIYETGAWRIEIKYMNSTPTTMWHQWVRNGKVVSVMTFLRGWIIAFHSNSRPRNSLIINNWDWTGFFIIPPDGLLVSLAGDCHQFMSKNFKLVSRI